MSIAMNDDPGRPTLTQVQIIQSLAEALSWFEKEISWGVSLGELRHLTGRIGELYAAMITRGQMTLDTNQRGYDVVSAANERISVKTATTSNHVDFNQNTYHHVDRVMVFRVNVDDEKGVSVEELLDRPAEEARQLMREQGGKLVYLISRGTREERLTLPKACDQVVGVQVRVSLQHTHPLVPGDTAHLDHVQTALK